MVRGGSNKLVPNTDVVVGDVLVLATGDKVTAGMALLTLMTASLQVWHCRHSHAAPLQHEYLKCNDVDHEA